MFEILKILLEEPGRFRKFGILLVRFILNSIFASHIYTWSLGNYHIIDIVDISAWVEFVLSGRILICILLYVFSDFILFQILSIISIAPLDRMAKVNNSGKPDKVEKKLIMWIFKISEILIVEKETNKLIAGKNTDSFLEFLHIYSLKESKDEIYSFKNSFATEILHTYFVFVLIYIFSIYEKGDNFIINSIVITGCVILPLLYLALCGVIDFMDKNAKGLIFAVRGLKFENLISEVLKENGIHPMNVSNAKEVGYDKIIFYNNNEYILKFQYGKRPVSDFVINRFRSIFLKASKKMVLITNTELTSNAKDIVNEHKNSLVVIVFKDEADLVTQLETYFKEK